MVIGPGGAGVSVTAASAALRSSGRRARGAGGGPSTAEAGHDTLLVTTDRWSPTAGVLGVFRRAGEPVPVSTRLHLLSLDRLALLEATWSEFTTVLGQTLRASKVALPGLGAVADIAPGELATLPGVEDFLVLRRIRDEAVSGRWRQIVVDGSGFGDPFEFLRAGSVLSQTLNRLWPRHRRLAAAAERPVMAQLTAAVDAIDRDCLDIAGLLTDSHVAAVHLVVPADDRGTRVLPHLLATVDVMGLALRSVVLNRGAGPASTDRRVAALRASIGDDRDGDDRDGDDRDGDIVITELDRLPDTIDRAARLRKLGVALPGPNGRPRGSGAARVTEIPAPAGPGPMGQGSGESRFDQAYEMSWRQRLPEPDTLALGRSGDDLLVTVGGFRHPVRLPSVLRRCIVTDATWDGTDLTVRFVPDPALWPRGG